MVLGKRPRKWTSQGPPAAVGERYLTAGLGCPLGRPWPIVKAFGHRGFWHDAMVTGGRSQGGERPMGTTAYGGKGSKGRVANGK